MLLFIFSSAAFAQQGGTQDYLFGFLRAHPERKELPAAEAMEIQKGHMAHLNKMAVDGILVGAGPLLESPDLRGVLIFKGVTLEQARKAAEADPAVAAKRLWVDLAEWPGPAGIGETTAAWARENPGAFPPMSKRTLVVYSRTSAFPAKAAAPEEMAVLEGHRAFIAGLHARADLLAVGPMRGSKEFVGVAVYAGEDVAAALKLCAEDPFVRQGWVRPQAFVWYVAEATFPKR